MATAQLYSATSSSSAVAGSPLAVASASVLMAEGCSRYLISGWGLTKHNIHLPSDLDDTEDFQLTKGANVERFRLVLVSYLKRTSMNNLSQNRRVIVVMLSEIIRDQVSSMISLCLLFFSHLPSTSC